MKRILYVIAILAYGVCACNFNRQLNAQTNSASVNSTPSEGVVRNQLKDFVANILNCARKKDVKIINLLTEEYKSFGEDMLAALDPHRPLAEAVSEDFNYYSIKSIERVIIDKNIAFIQVKVAYDKSALVDLRDEEKDKVASKTDTGTTWSSGGGTSSENTFEKDGLGRATYYLVVQNGAWRIHYTYFSLKPMSDTGLAAAAKELKHLAK